MFSSNQRPKVANVYWYCLLMNLAWFQNLLACNTFDPPYQTWLLRISTILSSNVKNIGIKYVLMPFTKSSVQFQNLLACSYVLLLINKMEFSCQFSQTRVSQFFFTLTHVIMDSCLETSGRNLIWTRLLVVVTELVKYIETAHQSRITLLCSKDQ